MPIGSLMVAGVILVVGLGGAWWWWRTRRGAPLPEVGRVIAAPDDTSPAIGAALLRRSVEPAHMVALLIDLGRRGAVAVLPVAPHAPTVTPPNRQDLSAIFEPPAELRRLPVPALPPSPHETAFLDYLFAGGTGLTREGARSQLRLAWSNGVYGSGVLDEIARRGLVARRPRLNPLLVTPPGCGLIFLALVGCNLLLVAISEPVALAPGLAVIIVAGAWLQALALTAWQLTATGARASAMWRGYEAYLTQLCQSNQVAEFGDSARHLPGLIAFGLDRGWVARWRAVAPSSLRATASDTPASPDWLAQPPAAWVELATDVAAAFAPGGSSATKRD